VLQLGLAVAIAVMGMVDPRTQPVALATAAVVVAFLSASQDVVIDAYKADVLAPAERAAGSAAYVMGYRVALLVTGTLALVLSDHLPWRVIYGGMAALMIVGVGATLWAPEPAEQPRPRSFTRIFYEPVTAMVNRFGIGTFVLVLVFAVAYRFGDYFAQVLLIPFLKKGLGFSSTDIGLVNKLIGFIATALGAGLAGTLVAKYSARRLLVPFALAAALTNLLYMWMAVAGKSYVVFCTAVFIDHTTTALATTVFLAVLMGTTSPAVSATQFALLTSLSSYGQRVFGFLANDVVERWNWSGYFAATVILAIPGILLAWVVSRSRRLEI
jgi:PAT family beta-lactamase induction signal transducer AmpG